MNAANIRFVGRLGLFLNAGLLFVGCASFDTTFTDQAELEESQWGTITQTQPEHFIYNNYVGPPPFSSRRPTQAELENRLSRYVDSIRDSAPWKGPTTPR